MSEWQEIDTAPKDGRVIILGRTQDWSLGIEGISLPGKHENAVWLELWGYDFYPSDYPPTHWMPFPKPPQD